MADINEDIAGLSNSISKKKKSVACILGVLVNRRSDGTFELSK